MTKCHGQGHQKGTAREAPTGPRNQVQKAMARKTANGLRCRECSCRSCDVRHGVGFLERKVPLTTRPALTACDQTAPQADALLMSPSVRSSRARCASGMSAMIFAHTASTL